ncbi:MAG: autotransporter domain-containing protein, partial [Phenylobacterium sp.]
LKQISVGGKDHIWAITATLLSDAQASARAVNIEAGAHVLDLQNDLTISATASGQKADAVAIVDHSGTLSFLENTRTISATLAPTDPLATVTGRAIALDLTANTTGVHISQIDFSSGATPPSITGEVLLGSGGDRLDILAGTVTGDIALGAGANALTIDGGAAVTGRLTADGGTLALSLANGSLQINNAGVIHATSLNVSAASKLVFTADPAAGGATELDVAGSAVIASGAKIGLRFASLLTGSATYTLVRADQLSVGTIDSSLLGGVPFIYTSSLAVSPAAGTVAVTVTRKTAADLQLPAATASAYEPLIQALGRDSRVSDVVLAQTTRAGLIGLYNQMLPNRSGGVFQAAAAATEAFARPLDERQDAGAGGFWVQEVNTGLVSDGHDDLPGYKAWGLGFVGGYEWPVGGLGVLGATLGADSNQIDDDGAASGAQLIASLVEAGVYWRGGWRGFSANARLAGDYLSMTSDRVVSAADSDGTNVSRTARGRWSGTGLSARVNAGYEVRWNSLYLRPQASLSYMRLMEGGYDETGGGDAVDLTVDSRTSSRLAGFAGVALGAMFGDDVSWGPELLVGYRTVVSEQLGATTARFTSGGDPFSLAADEVGGQGLAAHLSFKGENSGGGFALDLGTEMRDGLAVYDLRLAAHFQF